MCADVDLMGSLIEIAWLNSDPAVAAHCGQGIVALMRWKQLGLLKYDNGPLGRGHSAETCHDKIKLTAHVFKAYGFPPPNGIEVPLDLCPLPTPLWILVHEGRHAHQFDLSTPSCFVGATLLPQGHSSSQAVAEAYEALWESCEELEGDLAAIGALKAASQNGTAGSPAEVVKARNAVRRPVIVHFGKKQRTMAAGIQAAADAAPEDADLQAANARIQAMLASAASKATLANMELWTF